MRSSLLSVLALLLVYVSFSQFNAKTPAKYPALLWQISGNGLSKPSWLFGTMHVSSKLAFHLSDSFYYGLRMADVVALETNPGTWQEDFSRYDLDGGMHERSDASDGVPDDFITQHTFQIGPWEKKFQAALSRSPSIINSFLYRANSETAADFEENTYLDLYIYQIGRKWKKKVCGVENFDQSMLLMKEAYADAMKDKSRRNPTLAAGGAFSGYRLEEAYRSGNLDLVDTINKLNSFSDVFDEKFLYARNLIQARAIDSILKTGNALFVGVGAAHLPGRRGVIEWLRSKGYTVRPVGFTESVASAVKNDVEKTRVPVTFQTQSSDDAFYTVRLPGKLFQLTGRNRDIEQKAFSDMANGSYYMVSRIRTNAAVLGQPPETVFNKVDSLIYENIPGRVISKKIIERNGYKGLDIVNHTRRGDDQRYQIFVTPLELLIFKMSGNDEYVVTGTEANEFFNSISLRPYQADWHNFSPPSGGFAVLFPGTPEVVHHDGWRFSAADTRMGAAFMVMRSDIHNYHFIEEDTFDLALMEESFATSSFLDRQIARKMERRQGFPSLTSRFVAKDGSLVVAIFLIQGPHYYTALARGAASNKMLAAFERSFTITPFQYGQKTWQIDTTLHFRVNVAFNINEESKLSLLPDNVTGDDEEPDNAALTGKRSQHRVVRDDETGETVYIAEEKAGRYGMVDTGSVVSAFRSENNFSVSALRRSNRDGLLITSFSLVAPNSSRVIKVKAWQTDGCSLAIQTETDSFSKDNTLQAGFFDSFSPVWPSGTRDSSSVLDRMFTDFHNMDPQVRRMAIAGIRITKFDSSEFLRLKDAINNLNWKDRHYMQAKEAFVGKLAAIRTSAASDYLNNLYYSSGDTVSLQYAALKALLAQQTAYSYKLFAAILRTDPPVLDEVSAASAPPGETFGISTTFATRETSAAADRSVRQVEFIAGIEDSLKLAAGIFPDLLPLANLTDYEASILLLAAHLVDSGYIRQQEYESIYSKILLEAKQETKKQLIREKRKRIEEMEKDASADMDDELVEPPSGNPKLLRYAALLMPFYETDPLVQQLMKDLVKVNDDALKYDAMLLMLRYHKPVQDSLILHFARQDAFRSQLYRDLRRLRLLSLFPTAQSSRIDIARSELVRQSFNKPDTLLLLGQLPLKIQNKRGFIYFFAYKSKKQEVGWRLATSGLLPAERDLLFEEEEDSSGGEAFDFTELTDTRLSETVPIRDQMNRLLKKQRYGKRKSAAHFYQEDYSGFQRFEND